MFRRRRVTLSPRPPGGNRLAAATGAGSQSLYSGGRCISSAVRLVPPSHNSSGSVAKASTRRGRQALPSGVCQTFLRQRILGHTLTLSGSQASPPDSRCGRHECLRRGPFVAAEDHRPPSAMGRGCVETRAARSCGRRFCRLHAAVGRALIFAGSVSPGWPASGGGCRSGRPFA
jgi:hypothetical protein